MKCWEQTKGRGHARRHSRSHFQREKKLTEENLKRKRERFLRLVRRARERKERGSAGDKKKTGNTLKSDCFRSSNGGGGKEGSEEGSWRLSFSFILLLSLSLSQRCHEKEAIGDARCGHRQQHESKQRLKEAKGAKEKGKASPTSKLGSATEGESAK